MYTFLEITNYKFGKVQLALVICGVDISDFDYSWIEKWAKAAVMKEN
jgi:hypothetical protein